MNYDILLLQFCVFTELKIKGRRLANFLLLLSLFRLDCRIEGKGLFSDNIHMDTVW